MFPIEKENIGFHTKGYIFNKKDERSLIIGSSNLTANALSKNKEWNIKFSSKSNPSVVHDAVTEFEKMWEQSAVLTSQWIDSYELRYIQSVNVRKRELFPASKNYGVKVPNAMQEEALLNLRRLRENGETKALLISATGTGKTLLSAFDVKASGAKKVLFLVHREQILDDAKNSYGEVFSSQIRMGKISGTCKDYDADFIFSTIQSMSQEQVRARFGRDYFDYVVFDEVHHSSPGETSQYRKLLEYFTPKFKLGMTATPERTDGADIFKQFDFNIAYELRLKDAMKQEMLCPFHYYGISDILVDGKPIDDEEDFNSLVSEERVKHIMEKAEFYGYSGNRVKGLIFCRSIEEGRELSAKLNEKGWRTAFLCGETPQNERRDAVNRLEQKGSEGALDYIITRDIFNEGIDIRTVNQAIMLRPTESAIIFIQQLGRGLRKVASDGEKEYLVVIDFIGNYKNNFLIPIALSGNSALTREALRKFVRIGSIPGCSTISFDTITESKIYESINKTSDLLKLMKEKYRTLIKMLDYEPSLSQLFDLMKTSTAPIDPLEITKQYGTLNNFKSVLKLSSFDFDDGEEAMLKYTSRELMKGMRPQELKILKEVIEHGSVDLEDLKKDLDTEYSLNFEEVSWDSAIAVLDGSYSNDDTGGAFIHREGKMICASDSLNEHLEAEGFRESMLDAVDCGLKIFKKRYSLSSDSVFQLYERYGRYDVIRMLNFTKKIVAQNIGGYFADKSLHVCPIFVTYQKSSDINASVKYDDRFLDYKTFNWMSKNKRNLESPDVLEILNPECRLYLFIQKGDDDSTDFYYMGRIRPIQGS